METEKKGLGIKINKGVELMLRRVKKEEKPEPEKGLKILKTFTLRKKQFFFRFEISWRDLN